MYATNLFKIADDCVHWFVIVCNIFSAPYHNRLSQQQTPLSHQCDIHLHAEKQIISVKILLLILTRTGTTYGRICNRTRCHMRMVR